ncbi:MAG TPA: tetratricopeptide repeat protein, partial [Kiritimatiellia bacterium]
FGLAWFAFALGVALAKNFTELVPTTQVLAERFLYLPMCGLAFCIAETFDRFTAARARTVAAGVLVVAAMALGAATFIRALQWKDEVVLYTADLGKDPFSDRILRNLASTHVEAGRYAEARAVLEPWRDRLIPEDLATLGFTQFATGDRDQGRALVESVVKAGSASARPYVYLGAIYGLEGRYVDAEQWLQEALRKRGDAKVRSIAYNNLGIVLRSAGDLEQAEQSFREAAQLYPLYVEPWRNLGALLWNAGEWPEAADVYERLVTLQPGEAEWRESAEEARRQAGRPR